MIVDLNMEQGSRHMIPLGGYNAIDSSFEAQGYCMGESFIEVECPVRSTQLRSASRERVNQDLKLIMSHYPSGTVKFIFHGQTCLSGLS